MRINNVLQKANLNKKAYGFTLTFPSATILEIMANAGFDFVSFDGEHGAFNLETIDDLCHVADGFGLTPMARVPDIEPSTILQYLDRGVMGITGPHISSKSKALQLANSCRYSPIGKRSFGSGRGAYYGDLQSVQQYMEHTNSNILVIAQLEDISVLDELDQILQVNGINYFTSGAQDIAQSINLPGKPEHPEVKDFEKKVRDIVHAAGKMMEDEVMTTAKFNNLVLKAGKSFIIDTPKEP